MKRARLVEVFRRALREARLDIDKYTRMGRPNSDDIRKADYAQPQPSNTAFTMADDVLQQIKADDERTAQGKADAELDHPKLRAFLPRPKQGSGALDPQSAKAWGWKKITNFYVNPKHWARGESSDPGSVQWEGSDYLRPVSSAAQRLARKLQAIHKPGKSVYVQSIWNQYFKDDWGNLDLW